MDKRVGTIGVIPARYDSTRLPGKLLKKLTDKVVLEHTWEQVKKAKHLEDVIIAAADDKIYEAAVNFGATVVKVYDDLPSGSDRIKIAVDRLFEGQKKPEIVVNIQGDEPLIDPNTIDTIIKGLTDDEAVSVTTAGTRFTTKHEFYSNTTVKVIRDINNHVLLFSRAPIPFGWKESNPVALRHLGIYAYRWDALKEFVKIKPTALELIEKLEQLRLLYHGFKYSCVEVSDEGVGVDALEDFSIVKEILDSRT